MIKSHNLQFAVNLPPLHINSNLNRPRQIMFSSFFGSSSTHSKELKNNPAEYARDKIKDKVESINEAAKDHVNAKLNSEYKWFRELSPNKSNLFCCACSPCYCVLKISSDSAIKKSVKEAKGTLLSKTEDEAIDFLLETLGALKSEINSSEKSSDEQQTTIQSVTAKTINAIKNTVSNPEVLKMRPYLTLIIGSIESVHNIKLDQEKKSEIALPPPRQSM